MREATYGRRRRPKNCRANEHDQVMIRIIVSLSLSSLGFGEMNFKVWVDPFDDQSDDYAFDFETDSDSDERFSGEL